MGALVPDPDHSTRLSRAFGFLGISSARTQFRPAVSTRQRNLTWISVVVALFMVAVLPACWYGAQTRAFLQGALAPAGSNANSNEEHREHEEGAEEGAELLARSSEPLTPPRVVAVQRADRPRHDDVTPRIVHLYIPHPSRYSERRLI